MLKQNGLSKICFAIRKTLIKNVVKGVYGLIYDCEALRIKKKCDPFDWELVTGPFSQRNSFKANEIEYIPILRRWRWSWSRWLDKRHLFNAANLPGNMLLCFFIGIHSIRFGWKYFKWARWPVFSTTSSTSKNFSANRLESNTSFSSNEKCMLKILFNQHNLF